MQRIAELYSCDSENKDGAEGDKLLQHKNLPYVAVVQLLMLYMLATITDHGVVLQNHTHLLMLFKGTSRNVGMQHLRAMNTLETSTTRLMVTTRRVRYVLQSHKLLYWDCV